MGFVTVTYLTPYLQDYVRSVQSTGRVLRAKKSIPEYALKTKETARGTVVVDLTEAATAWVWTQEHSQWEHVAERAHYPYDCRLRISDRLYTMLQLRF